MTSPPPETAGQRLVSAFEADLEEHGLTLDPREGVHLDQAAAVLDRLEEIRRRIRRTGLLVENDKSGAIKANPLLHVERVLQQDLVRLLARIGLEAPPEVRQLTPAEAYRKQTRGAGPRKRAQRDRIARGED